MLNGSIRSLILALLAVVLSVSACSDSGTGEVSVASTLMITSEMTLIDVRDLVEYEAGHLPGAVHLSFNDGTLEAELPSLNTESKYVLYCRSGNRSGQAAEMMRAAGFSDVTDLGGLEEALASTGLALVVE